MDRELELLLLISENEQISQRQLAKSLDISLGTVNGLISQMIKSNLLKVEQAHPKQSRYFLTDLGFKEKAKKQYMQICNSYNTIAKAKAHIKNIVESKVKQNIKVFYILGEEDEVYKLVKMALIELKRDYTLEYMHISDISFIDNIEDGCILYWDCNILDEAPRHSVMII